MVYKFLAKKYWLKRHKDFEKILKIECKVRKVVMLDNVVWVLDSFPKNKAFEPQKFFIHSKYV